MRTGRRCGKIDVDVSTLQLYVWDMGEDTYSKDTALDFTGT
jgi:hypothetical protein